MSKTAISIATALGILKSTGIAPPIIDGTKVINKQIKFQSNTPSLEGSVVTSYNSKYDNSTSTTHGHNEVQYFNQRTNSKKNPTGKQTRKLQNEILEGNNTVYEINRSDKYFGNVLDALGFKGNDYTRVQVLEDGNVIAYKKNGKKHSTIITDRIMSKVSSFMTPVSHSSASYDSSDSGQGKTLNTSGQDKDEKKKKEKKKDVTYTSTKKYSSEIKNVQLCVGDPDGHEKTLELLIEEKGSDTAYVIGQELNKNTEVKRGGYVRVDGTVLDLTYPNTNKNIPGATSELYTKSDYKQLRKIFKRHRKKLKEGLISKELIEDILRANNYENASIRLYMQTHNKPGENCSSFYFNLNIDANEKEIVVEKVPVIQEKEVVKEVIKEVIKTVEKKVRVDRKRKNTFRGTYFNNRGASVSYGRQISGGSNVRLILEAEAGMNVNGAMDPIKIQDHDFYSEKFAQNVNSSSILTSQNLSKYLALYLNLELGKSEGIRGGLKLGGGVSFREFGLSLNEHIKGLDYNNVLENRDLDLGKLKGDVNYFFEAMGYVKVPISKRIDIYVAAGGKSQPGYMVSEINGEPIISNIPGLENGIPMIKGGVKGQLEGGIQFKF